MQMGKIRLLNIVQSFLKIGIIGFGGGSALIPVVEKEVVEVKKLISEEDYTEDVIVANITPGALPVKLGAAAGQRVAGYFGMLLGAFSVALPGTFLTILILSLISVLGSGFLEQVEFASVGISAFIILVLLFYIKRVLHDSKGQDFGKQAVIIMLLSAGLTSGKELLLIGASLWKEADIFKVKPLFDISTMDLLLITFFVIFYTGGQFHKIRVPVTALLSIVYVLCIEEIQLNAIPYLKTAVIIAMAVLALWGVVCDAKQEGYRGEVCAVIKKTLIQVACFVLVTAIIAIPVFLVLKNTGGYIIDGALSTVTSFGGGEAYLTVAEGIFVSDSGISSKEFYSQIVPVANALPGPILVKILSGIGYMLGFNASGVSAGWLAALLGLALGVGASCSVFLLVFSIYKTFSSLPVFRTLKIWILPVICGLLISTMLAMIVEMLKITSIGGMFSGTALLLFVFIIAGAWFLHKKYHLYDVWLILICGAISIGVLNIIR